MFFFFITTKTNNINMIWEYKTQEYKTDKNSNKQWINSLLNFTLSSIGSLHHL